MNPICFYKGERNGVKRRPAVLNNGSLLNCIQCRARMNFYLLKYNIKKFIKQDLFLKNFQKIF